MHKNWIVDYTERVAPETAYKNNTESTRKIIESDVVKELSDDRELIDILPAGEKMKAEIFTEFNFLSKWIVAFRRCGNI